MMELVIVNVQKSELLHMGGDQWMVNIVVIYLIIIQLLVLVNVNIQEEIELGTVLMNIELVVQVEVIVIEDQWKGMYIIGEVEDMIVKQLQLLHHLQEEVMEEEDITGVADKKIEKFSPFSIN